VYYEQNTKQTNFNLYDVASRLCLLNSHYQENINYLYNQEVYEVKKNSAFLIIGIVMIIVAICFVNYALNNPQSSFSWNNSITYGIYLVYVIGTIFFIVKGLKK
jgi:hypothetical protein